MKVKVLDHDVKIIFVPEAMWADDDLYADFDHMGMTIRIIKNLNFDQFWNSYFHEITHVKQFLFGLPLCEAEANRDALFLYSLLKKHLPKLEDIGYS